ncbi:MAG TPA: sugar transferase [Acidimicrobiales bacterium]|jgi:lipopolysaccharide/colanic/teichoic acid biosynthesis glycosyltransferase
MTRRAARPLLYFGTVAIVLGLAKVHARYIGDYVLHSTDPARLVWTLAFIGLLVLASYGAGLPELPRTPRQAFTSAVVAPASAALGISVVQLLLGDALLPRFVVFGSALALVPWNLFCVAIAQGARARGERRDRVVLVASHDEAIALQDELDAHPERPAVLVAAMTPDEAVPVAVLSKPLSERVLAASATVIVLDRVALASPVVVAQAAALHEAGVRVRTLSLFYEEWIGKLPLSELERASLLFDIREVHGSRYVRLKRLLDFALGSVGLVALIVVMPFVAAGNVIANRGPFLYRQERIGKGGRRFSILKFRTMRRGDGGLANEWTRENDPRITPFGRLMRRTHLDELPQVINIVRGDLSIVGPRPEQPHYVEELSEKLPFYSLRHLVRPGLTGWAQVKYGYAGDERDALEKLQYEFWYLRNQNLGLDLRIVGRTVRSVAGHDGR